MKKDGWVSLVAALPAFAAALGIQAAAHAQPCKAPNMLIVQDISSSMTGEINGTSKWSSAKSAVKKVTDKYGLSSSVMKVRFGLEVFANPDQSNYPPPWECDVFGINCPDDCKADKVHVGVADNNAAAVQGRMNSVEPWSLTPIKRALNVALGYSALKDTARQNFVLLVTDGIETCDGTNDSVAVATSLKNAGIKTYVVGFGSGVDADLLNSLAIAGGTAMTGTTKYYQADNQAALESALDVIAGQVASGDCTVPGKLGECAKGVKQCVNGQITCGQVIFPVTETCDGRDEDCDGTIDDGNPGGGGACTTGKPGICSAGTKQCQSGKLNCVQTNQPKTEICNNLDDDCDGTVDDGNPGGGGSCDTGYPGECAAGTKNCKAGKIECTPKKVPKAEICNNLDEDCDGTPDNGDPGGGVLCASGLPGECAIGETHCLAGVVACVANRQPSEEMCNALDDDCDGVIDDGVRNACGKCGPVPSETCNGIDDDCDGVIDDGAECVETGKVCVNGECVGSCINNECPRGLVCRESGGESYCVSPCNGVECPFGWECDPLSGECFNQCEGVECPPDKKCWGGQCIPKDCHESGCPAGYVCATSGECVKDPCAGVRCDQDEQCVDGKCEPSCANVSCPLWQHCVDGKCIGDPCDKVTCPEGKKCSGGVCVEDPCEQKQCGSGYVCINDVCVEDPCLKIKCPGGQVCVDGECRYEETVVDGGTTGDGGGADGGGGDGAEGDSSAFDDGSMPQDGAAVTDGGASSDGAGQDDGGGGVRDAGGGASEGDNGIPAGCSCSTAGAGDGGTSLAALFIAVLAAVSAALAGRRRN
jgi:MYXO-CTERM domain-containing protein